MLQGKARGGKQAEECFAQHPATAQARPLSRFLLDKGGTSVCPDVLLSTGTRQALTLKCPRQMSMQFCLETPSAGYAPAPLGCCPALWKSSLSFAPKLLCCSLTPLLHPLSSAARAFPRRCGSPPNPWKLLSCLTFTSHRGLQVRSQSHVCVLTTWPGHVSSEGAGFADEAGVLLRKGREG